MTTAQQLEQIFGVAFEEKPDLTALRRFEANNAFCCDTSGAVTGLCSCENAFSSLVIPQQLNSLRYLNLSDNEALEALTFEGPFPALEHLDVSDCALRELKLADEFGALAWLDASRNQIAHFVPQGDYGQLRHLDLSGNQLSSFNAGQIQKFTTLERLYLKDNPLPASKKTSVDREPNCLEFMRDFQRALEQGDTENREYKVLVVGNGGVGKTCLVERLIYNRFEEKHHSTHGVSLEQYVKPEEFPYILNLWDFGGQDIYHATHRLFMQSGGVYLALWDEYSLANETTPIVENEVSRDYKNYDLPYWLYYIQLQGSHSPVIVIKTKARDNGREHPDRAHLKAEYGPAFLSLDFHQVDSALNDWSDNGFNRLLFFIKEAIGRLKRQEELPQSWADLRQHIRDLQRKKVKALSLEDYRALAGDYGLEEQAQGILENWLVPAGVVFYRKGFFDDAIVLDQGWAMKAVYTIFNRTQKFNYYTVLESQGGRFSGADLAEIWSERSQAEQELFLTFMLSCELCFEVTDREEDRHPSFVQRQFVAPQLMTPNPPEAAIKYFRSANQVLYVRYRHRLLHYGIIQSFIVRTQSLAKVDEIWRFGTLLEENDVGALIYAQGNDIVVEVPTRGVELLGKIRHLLAELQQGKGAEWVSLDGKAFVEINKLRKSKATHIEADNGDIIETKLLAPFTEERTREQFDLKRSGPQDAAIIGQLEKEEMRKKKLTAAAVIKPLDFGQDTVNVLFLAAHPAKYGRISWEKEQSHLAKKVANSSFRISPQNAVSLDDILDAVSDSSPKIIHFCGHGKEEVIEEGHLAERGGIVVHSEDKQSEEVLSAIRLSALFRQVKQNFPGLELVFLNACHSESPGPCHQPTWHLRHRYHQ